MSILLKDVAMYTRSMKKGVTIPLDKSLLEKVCIIPNLDELNNYPVIVIHEVFRLTPNTFHGLTGRRLISKAMSILNDMIMCADSFPENYSSYLQSRDKVQELCINPIVDVISVNSGIDVLSFDFDVKKLDKSTRISNQIKNDFVKMLVSAFNYHEKSICKRSPRGSDRTKEIHLSISDGSYNHVKDAHNITIRSYTHPDNAFIYK